MNAPVAIDGLEAPQSERQNTPAFSDYLRILLRHRYSILGLVLLFALLGGLRAAMETPIFRSTATLLIDREAARYVQVQEVYGAQAQSFEYFQTQYEILRTWPLAERTAQAIGGQRLIDGNRRQSGFSLSRLLGRTPAPPTNLSEAEQLRNGAGIVQGNLSIQPIRNSQLVRISVDLPDAELAAAVANAHGRSYIESMLEARVEMVGQATSFLSGRTSKMRGELELAERALEDYKRREGLIEGGVSGLPTQELALLSGQLTAAQTERLNKEVLYTQVSNALKNGTDLATISGLSNDPAVETAKNKLADARKRQAELATRYGPGHPSIQAVSAEIATVERELNGRLQQAADLIQQSYQAARQIESQMRGQYESARARLQDASSKSVELNRLERDLEAKRQVYDKFQTQFNETSGIKGLDTANARLVELAQPGGAIYPNIRRSVLAAALLGLLIGVGLAFVLDHLDSTIKTAEDVERRLQAPVLGLIPTLKTSGKKDSSPLRHFTEHPRSAFAESVRTARTNILLSGINQQHRRLLVTSSVPSEGKTTTALNLAQALAQMNKVLLIDADMRRPSVARVFPSGTAPAKGLSQFISGEARVSDCVRQLEQNGPYVMTAGVIPPNPLELLSSPRFSEALDSLSKVFEFIVIDCAPTLAVSDALVLAKLVDGVIYIVKSDATPYQAAQSGIRRLRRIDAPLLGVVLNRIGERAHGYGYGRYSYYADGYHAYSSYYQSDSPGRKKK